MNKVLIVGGAGFIGSFLSKALNKYGFEVDIATRSLFYTYKPEKNKIERIVEADQIPNLTNYRIIIYLAWATNPKTASESPKKDLSDSLMPAIDYLDKIAGLSSKPIFMFFSSGGSIYGMNNLICQESDCLDPLNPYGIAKTSFEKYLRFYSLKYDLPVIIIRPSNVYGPYKVGLDQGVIQNFLVSAINKKYITIWGDGSTIRDYLYIDDLINLIIMVINKELLSTSKTKFFILNAGSNVGYSVNEIASIIQNLLGQQILIKHVEQKIPAVNINILDNSLARTKYGWKPECSINQGILQVFNYFKMKYE
jgi:UDP-glucose 4-epimerase